jgi:hypothetical protein
MLNLYSLAPKDSVLANAVGTAKFCLFMDKTFDSVNASTINAELGKPLRSAVRGRSPHVDHWKYAIKVFESMKFINKTNGKTMVPPSVKNWIFSLKSFNYLWLQLKKSNLKYFLPRHINQDPLECLFGSVRSHGIRNINPNSYQFICSFKTLLINNFMSIKSAGNCEHDDSENALYNLKQFIESGSSVLSEDDVNVNVLSISMIDIPIALDASYLTDMTIGYVCGYLARSVLKDTNFCRLCKNELVGDVENNDLIRVRDYTKKSLLYPSDSFKNIINQMFYITKNILPNISQQNIGKHLIFLFEINVDFNITCPKHDLKSLIFEKFKNFFLFTYVKNINRILNGLDRNKYNCDNLKKSAHEYYLKNSKHKK